MRKMSLLVHFIDPEPQIQRGRDGRQQRLKRVGDIARPVGPVARAPHGAPEVFFNRKIVERHDAPMGSAQDCFGAFGAAKLAPDIVALSQSQPRHWLNDFALRACSR